MPTYHTIDISSHTAQDPAVEFVIDSSRLILKDNTNSIDIDLTDGYRHIFVDGTDFHVEVYDEGDARETPTSETHFLDELVLNHNFSKHMHFVTEYRKVGYKKVSGQFIVDDEDPNDIFPALIGTDDFRHNVSGFTEKEIKLRIFNLSDQYADLRINYDDTTGSFRFVFAKSPISVPYGALENKMFQEYIYRMS